MRTRFPAALAALLAMATPAAARTMCTHQTCFCDPGYSYRRAWLATIVEVGATETKLRIDAVAPPRPPAPPSRIAQGGPAGERLQLERSGNVVTAERFIDADDRLPWVEPATSRPRQPADRVGDRYVFAADGSGQARLALRVDDDGAVRCDAGSVDAARLVDLLVRGDCELQLMAAGLAENTCGRGGGCGSTPEASGPSASALPAMVVAALLALRRRKIPDVSLQASKTGGRRGVF